MVMNLYIAAEENLRKASTFTLSNLGAAYELILDQNCPFTLSQRQQRSWHQIRLRGLQGRLHDFLCWAVSQPVVCLTQNTRHLVAFFLRTAFQGSTAACFLFLYVEEKSEIKPCPSLQLGWILTVGRPKLAAFKEPLNLIF